MKNKTEALRRLESERKKLNDMVFEAMANNADLTEKSEILRQSELVDSLVSEIYREKRDVSA